MTAMNQSNERGIAMLLALFMSLALSVLGTSLMFVSRAETLSSHNYRLMSQSRYGAESGIHHAANFLMKDYAVPTTTSATDPWGAYTFNADGTVTLSVGGVAKPIVLSTNPAIPSNYPSAAVRNAFEAAVKGSLNVNDGTVDYNAVATLVSMRKFPDAMNPGLDSVVQTWEITGHGEITGATPAQVEVSTVFEQQKVTVYPYAAFATSNGCGALDFAGGAITDSYNSAAALQGGKPVLANNTGNVGTNGNLEGNGNPTTINGSLSTPRSGVGNCTANNVTATTVAGWAVIENGLNKLSQPIIFPTPTIPTALQTSQSFTKNSGCPAGVSYCTGSADGATITPPSATTVVSLGNVDIGSHAVLHLGAGTYSVNSFNMNANAQIIIDSGPVIFKVEGTGVGTAIRINGNGISNLSYKPTDLQFQYAGTGAIDITGGSETSALFYAPNASATLNGNADLYGALVVKTLKTTGQGAIHYDRNLANSGFTPGRHTLSAFTWNRY